MERSSYIQACVVGVGPTGTRSDLRASNPVCLQGFFSHYSLFTYLSSQLQNHVSNEQHEQSQHPFELTALIVL